MKSDNNVTILFVRDGSFEIIKCTEGWSKHSQFELTIILTNKILGDKNNKWVRYRKKVAYVNYINIYIELFEFILFDCEIFFTINSGLLATKAYLSNEVRNILHYE